MLTVPYKNFERFVFRVPLFPVDIPLEMIIRSEVFREGLYLASPDLYEAFISNTAGSFEEYPLKLKLSLLKYALRSSNRCTPFGLFAGCGTGLVGAPDNAILIGSEKSHYSTTRLDMTLMCELSQHVSLLGDLQDRLIYRLNTSLYSTVNGYRYVEYRYTDNRRKYLLVELAYDPYLEKVINQCLKGAQRLELVKILIEDDIDEESAVEFIDALIAGQVIVSDFEPGVTGKDLMSQIIDRLVALDGGHYISEGLRDINDQLVLLDSLEPGGRIHYYKKLEERVADLKIKYSPKYLFQSDMTIVPVNAQLADNILDSVKDGIRVLCQINRRAEYPHLKSFREEFQKRYEQEEIPLTELLDTDFGIGFGNQVPENTVVNPLVDDLSFFLRNNKRPSAVDASYTLFENYLFTKYCACIKNGDSEIIITEDELEKFPARWDDLPDTIYTIVEIINKGVDGELPLISMHQAGGPSAANLLGRFCHTNADVYDLVEEIVRKENELIPGDAVIAEIVHLPESRTGNILYRPSVRSYEIPYLSSPSTDKENTISITDLMVSIREGRLVLRSKRLNKEVIPRLTTAHNYTNSTLPVYHFLSIFQNEQKRGGVSFWWSGNLSEMDYLPRVRYRNVILSPAQWKIKAHETKDIPAPDAKGFLEKALAFIRQKQLPDRVQLVEGDNLLNIDFTDPLAVQLLFNETKKRDFTLQEILSDATNALVKNEDGGSYNNEIIFTFYKSIAEDEH